LCNVGGAGGTGGSSGRSIANSSFPANLLEASFLADTLTTFGGMAGFSGRGTADTISGMIFGTDEESEPPVGTSGQSGIFGASGQAGMILGENSLNVCITNTTYAGAYVGGTCDSSGTLTTYTYTYIGGSYFGSTSGAIYLNNVGSTTVSNIGSPISSGSTTYSPTTSPTTSTTATTYNSNYNTFNTPFTMWCTLPLSGDLSTMNTVSGTLIGVPSSAYATVSAYYQVPTQATSVSSTEIASISNTVSLIGHELPRIFPFTINITLTTSNTTGILSTNSSTPFSSSSTIVVGGIGAENTAVYIPAVISENYSLSGICKIGFNLSEILATSVNINYGSAIVNTSNSTKYSIIIDNCALALYAEDAYKLTSGNPTTNNGTKDTSDLASYFTIPKPQLDDDERITLDIIDSINTARSTSTSSYYNGDTYSYNILGVSLLSSPTMNESLSSLFSIDTKTGIISMNTGNVGIEVGEYVCWVEVIKNSIPTNIPFYVNIKTN